MPSTEAPAVCLVLRYFTVGGLERVVIGLANRLAARGVDTRVVGLGIAPRNPLITELEAPVEGFSLSGPVLSRLRALRQLTAGRVVHLHLGDGEIQPLERAALFDRRTIVTYHSVYTHRRTRARNALDRAVTSRANAIVSVSEAVRMFCVHEVGLDPTRIRVIPNGVVGPAVVGEPAPAAERGRLSLVAVAGLYPHKNHATLINGLADARLQGIDATLRVIGDGPELAALYRRSVERGVRADIEWYGAIWRRDIVEPLVASADAFVSASRFEGMPISILEAMAAGLPLILSDIPPHREVAGDAARYFDAERPDELARRLGELADSVELRRSLAVRSRQRGLAADLEAAVESHLELYRAVAR
jgi:glycosyltransferase involved in cell wall biosynthesis